jgi:hypothetical protein
VLRTQHIQTKPPYIANAQHDINASSCSPHMGHVDSLSNENCIILGYHAILIYFVVEASNHEL